MSEAVINDALARMNEPEVKDRLKATTQEALDLGVSNLTGATGEFSRHQNLHCNSVKRVYYKHTFFSGMIPSF